MKNPFLNKKTKDQIKEQVEESANEKQEVLDEPEIKSGKNHVKAKIIALNVINLLLIAATFFVLSRFTQISQEIKKLRSENILAQEVSDVAVIKSDLSKSEDSIQSLKSVFVDDSGFIDFVSRVDALKNQGVVVDFTFPGGKPVRDKDKSFGFPVAITFQGSQEEVDNALKTVESLPYVLKPANVEVSFTAEGQTVLKYGAFLVVDESNFSN